MVVAPRVVIPITPKDEVIVTSLLIWILALIVASGLVPRSSIPESVASDGGDTRSEDGVALKIFVMFVI